MAAAAAEARAAEAKAAEAEGNGQNGAVSGQDRAIDVQITRLRRKIEPDPREPRYLQTVRGAGSIPAPYGGGEADISLGETSFGLSAGFKF